MVNYLVETDYDQLKNEINLYKSTYRKNQNLYSELSVPRIQNVI